MSDSSIVPVVIPAVPGPTDDPAMKHASDDRAWSTGLNDGMLGQTWREQRRVLEFEAESVRLDATCRIDQQLEDARAAERLAVEAHAREKATFEKIGAQLSATTADRAGHPSSYSRLLGSVYIAFAMLLIAADFPLTREVANTIGISARPGSFVSEQSVVAAGIVVISLLFKLVADQFMRPRYLMPKWWRPVVTITAFLLVVVILAGVAASLGVLGWLRGETIAAELDPGAAPSVFGAPAGPPTDTSGGAATPDPLAGMNTWSTRTFVALGLLLPLVGGIFASAGFARWHNAGRFRHLEKEHERLRSADDEAARRCYDAHAAVEKLNHDRRLVMDRPALAGGRYHLYLHGYERGFASPEARPGFGGIAAAVNRMVTRWVGMSEQSQNLVRTSRLAREAGQQPKEAP